MLRNIFFPRILLLTICLIIFSCHREETNLHPLKLWYKQPASEWINALPIGNGRLGAMVYGGIQIERIQLNEESLWAGSQLNNNNPEALKHLPEIRELLFKGQNEKALELSKKYLLGTPPRIRSYQTLGELTLDFGPNQPEVKNYRRELDLSKGIARTTYEQNGIQFTREIFCSAPANAIVMRLKAKHGKISTKIGLSRPTDAVVRVDHQQLIMEGQIVDKDDSTSGPGGKHMRFSAKVNIEQKGGSISQDKDRIHIKDASEITLYLTAATDYNIGILNFDPTLNPSATCDAILDPISNKAFEELKNDHIVDHQKIFSRVNLKLCDEITDTIPTDIRLKQVIDGKDDLHLEEVYFQYGRYLLMGSSRTPGVLPANLQGIWNNQLNAPWNSDFHTNINLQMNYWPAEVCNLPETLEPLTSFFTQLMLPGSSTARQMYGARGWTMHHVTDPFGRTGLMDGIQWGSFPMGGPWMALHFWEHYQFTKDSAYLTNQAWPLLKSSSLFLLDFFVKDHQGQFVSAPSYSPENAFYLPGTKTKMQLTYGATMDIQIARELFNVCLKAGKITYESKEYLDSIQNALNGLPATKIGKNGSIMEWINDYEEAEPGHRHISHLFGLHPGTQITSETPELFKAAAKTIAHRIENGGGHTGWSRAWIINFYARLMDGENAYQHLLALLRKSTLPNLFDNHPPFQIDGNFGGTAGIAEMLLQSHNGTIMVLPALPKAWKNGSIKGLKARGNYTVNIEWKNNRLYKLTIKTFCSQTCQIQYDSFKNNLNVIPDKSYEFDGNLKLISTIEK